MKIDVDGNWGKWWGQGALPPGAAALGVVGHENLGTQGALVRTAEGGYFQGNRGVLRHLRTLDVAEARLQGRSGAMFRRCGRPRMAMGREGDKL